MTDRRFRKGEEVLIRCRVKVDTGDRVKVWVPAVGGGARLCVVPAEAVGALRQAPRPPVDVDLPVAPPAGPPPG